MAKITIAAVRDDMLDRKAEDHLVLGDLAFTDEDIAWAMGAAARKYNSLRPIGISVNPECLPDTTTIFFDGIAWALLRRWHRNTSINDFDYTAGAVSANVQGGLSKNLAALVDKLEKDFVMAATDMKVSINVAATYGPLT